MGLIFVCHVLCRVVFCLEALFQSTTSVALYLSAALLYSRLLKDKPKSNRIMLVWAPSQVLFRTQLIGSTSFKKNVRSKYWQIYVGIGAAPRNLQTEALWAVSIISAKAFSIIFSCLVHSSEWSGGRAVVGDLWFWRILLVTFKKKVRSVRLQKLLGQWKFSTHTGVKKHPAPFGRSFRREILLPKWAGIPRWWNIAIRPDT